MIELTEEQRRALREGETVRVSGDEIGAECILVRADIYERVQSLINAGRLSLGEQTALLQAAGRRAGWNDPEMDVYDEEDDYFQAGS